jgi:hypothetical protein
VPRLELAPEDEFADEFEFCADETLIAEEEFATDTEELNVAREELWGWADIDDELLPELGLVRG